MNKLIKILLIVWLAPSMLLAQTPFYKWADKLAKENSLTNPSRQAGHRVDDMAKDSDGNIYIVGLLFADTNFGIDVNGNSITLSYTSNPQGYNAFFAKLSPNGKIVWAKKILGNISIPSIQIDKVNNIILGGTYIGNIDLDGNGTIDLLDRGPRPDCSNDGGGGLRAEEAFVAKFTSNATSLVWTRHANSNYSYFETMVVDGNGDIYVMGNGFDTKACQANPLSANIDFGNSSIALPLPDAVMPQGQLMTGYSTWLFKLSGSTGTAIWSTYNCSGSGGIRGARLDVDKNNNLYFFSSTDGFTRFVDKTRQTNPTTVISLGLGGGQNSLGSPKTLFRFNSNDGQITLHKMVYGLAEDALYHQFHVSKNETGNNYLYFSGYMPKDRLNQLNKVMLFYDNSTYYYIETHLPKGEIDAYVFKFDLEGNPIFVNGEFSGQLIPALAQTNPSIQQKAYGKGVVSDALGNYYVIGHYIGTLIEGDKSICTDGFDVFIAKYNSNNVLQWIRTNGSGSENEYVVLHGGYEGRKNIILKNNNSCYIKMTSPWYPVKFHDIVVENNVPGINTFFSEIDNSGGDFYYVPFNVSINHTSPIQNGEPMTLQATPMGSNTSLVYYIWEITNSEGHTILGPLNTSINNTISFTPNVGGSTYYVKVTANINNSCAQQTIGYYSFTTPPPLCDTRLFGGGITVNQVGNTGVINFDYSSPSCGGRISFDCMGGTPNESQTKVISASASMLQSEWIPTNANTTTTNYNPYEEGHKGRYYAKRAYTFNTQVPTKDQLGADLLNYELGTFSYIPFNWQSKGIFRPTKWLAPTEVEQYSLNGEALQEKNMLGTQSCAKFGYKGALAYMIAKNASQREVMFESFENVYPNNLLEDNLELGSAAIEVTKSHSGNRSVKMSGSNYQLKYQGTNNGLQATNHIKSKGLLVKFWLHTTEDNITNDGSMNVELLLGTSVAATKNIKIVAQTGLWRLCEATFTPSELNYLPLQSSFSINIKKNITGDFWIDDIAVQPYDAEIVNYVYDPKTLRLLASLDSQHFGMYYLYNDEGKLVRKQIETERGLKTIQETQYNTPKQDR